jgi:dihydrofolate reductase
MRRIVVFEHLTLDGVMRAPGRADEDRRGCFEHGGSGELVQTLMRRRLVDEYVLLIHTLVLGSGRRLSSDSGARAVLRLVEATASPSGVVIATYHQERG